MKGVLAIGLVRKDEFEKGNYVSEENRSCREGVQSLKRSEMYTGPESFYYSYCYYSYCCYL